MFHFTPPPIYLSRGLSIFVNCHKSTAQNLRMLHKQSPRPGAFLAPRPGAGGMILPVQSPNRASRRTKKLPPPMTQTKKQQGPGAICSRACCHFFMDNGSIFSGVLRRLLFVHNLCGDHDNAHCYQIVFLIGYLAKRSAHVAGVCGLLAAQARKVVCTTLVS